MTQLFVKDITFSRLTLLRAKAILKKSGSSVTWNDIILSLIEVTDKHENEFLIAMESKNGKTRTPKVILVK